MHLGSLPTWAEFELTFDVDQSPCHFLPIAILIGQFWKRLSYYLLAIPVRALHASS